MTYDAQTRRDGTGDAENVAFRAGVEVVHWDDDQFVPFLEALLAGGGGGAIDPELLPTLTALGEELDPVIVPDTPQKALEVVDAGFGIQAGQIAEKVDAAGAVVALNESNGNLEPATGTVTVPDVPFLSYQLTGDTVFDIPDSNLENRRLTFEIAQDGTGGWTVEFTVGGVSSVRWPGGTIPTWTTAAFGQDLVTLVCPGTDWHLESVALDAQEA